MAETAQFYHYRADSPGLSLFTIGVENDLQSTDSDDVTGGDGLGLGVLVTIVLALTLLLFAAYWRRRDDDSDWQ